MKTTRLEREIAYRRGLEDGYAVEYLRNVWPGIDVTAYIAGYRAGVYWASTSAKWQMILDQQKLLGNV